MRLLWLRKALRALSGSLVNAFPGSPSAPSAIRAIIPHGSKVLGVIAQKGGELAWERGYSAPPPPPPPPRAIFLVMYSYGTLTSKIVPCKDVCYLHASNRFRMRKRGQYQVNSESLLPERLSEMMSSEKKDLSALAMSEEEEGEL